MSNTNNMMMTGTQPQLQPTQSVVQAGGNVYIVGRSITLTQGTNSNTVNQSNNKNENANAASRYSDSNVISSVNETKAKELQEEMDYLCKLADPQAFDQMRALFPNEGQDQELGNNSLRKQRPDLHAPWDAIAAQPAWVKLLVEAHQQQDFKKFADVVEILRYYSDPRIMKYIAPSRRDDGGQLSSSTGNFLSRSLVGCHPSFLNSKEDQELTDRIEGDKDLKEKVNQIVEMVKEGENVRAIVGPRNPYDQTTKDHSLRVLQVDPSNKVCQLTSRTSEPASRYTGMTLKESIVQMKKHFHINTFDFVLGIHCEDGKGIFFLDYGAICGVPLKTITRNYINKANEPVDQSGKIGHAALGLMVQTGNFSALPIITSIDLSNCKLGHLGNYCFNNCPLLTKIQLHSFINLWVIGTHCFSNNPELVELTCSETANKNDILPCKIGEKSFINNPKLKIIQLKGSDGSLLFADRKRIYGSVPMPEVVDKFLAPRRIAYFSRIEKYKAKSRPCTRAKTPVLSEFSVE
jgi:hypothetical protein